MERGCCADTLGAWTSLKIVGVYYDSKTVVIINYALHPRTQRQLRPHTAPNTGQDYVKRDSSRIPVWPPGLHFASIFTKVAHLVMKQFMCLTCKGYKLADDVTVGIDMCLKLRIMGDESKVQTGRRCSSAQLKMKLCGHSLAVWSTRKCTSFMTARCDNDPRRELSTFAQIDQLIHEFHSPTNRPANPRAPLNHVEDVEKLFYCVTENIKHSPVTRTAYRSSALSSRTSRFLWNSEANAESHDACECHKEAKHETDERHNAHTLFADEEISQKTTVTLKQRDVEASLKIAEIEAKTVRISGEINAHCDADIDLIMPRIQPYRCS
ncbi:hypothetical protein DD238_000147 [Peronospora effusa]|uniref:Uncharacterized protein n=1 Tax=Peronospora effusa TaxID=542832 RepID=A0A3M6VR17_9STRA|nr:hypothetical protein DD238_000147 [Peronospora effusa]